MRILKMTMLVLAGVLIVGVILASGMNAARAMPAVFTMTPSPAPTDEPPPTNTAVPPSPTQPDPGPPPNTQAPPAATNTPAPTSVSSVPVATARVTTVASVSTSAPSDDGGPFRYSAKFVCGLQEPVTSGEPPVKPGNYATAINIHNYTAQPVSVTLRPALYYLVGGNPPPVVEARTVDIAPYRVLEVECNELWRMTGGRPGTFITGMLDIGARAALPMAAVYTAAITDRMDLTDTGAGISIDVEYLTPYLRP